MDDYPSYKIKEMVKKLEDFDCEFVDCYRCPFRSKFLQGGKYLCGIILLKSIVKGVGLNDFNN